MIPPVSSFSRTSNPCGSYPPFNPLDWWYGNGERVLREGRAYSCRSGHGANGNLSSHPGTGSSWSTYWNDLGACSAYTYNAAGLPPAPLDVLWYTNSSDDVVIGQGTLSAGVLIAPFATVRPQSGKMRGAIYANAIASGTSFELDSSEVLDALCSATEIAESEPSVCPIQVMRPPFNEPCATGRDCQVNHRCKFPATQPTCLHSKCEPGPPLEADCDECVSKICAVDSSCCEESWNRDCVNMVATVCDAVCDEASCLHGPCESGAPLEPSCDPCISTVCLTSGFESCCTDSWSERCALKFRDVCDASPTITPPSRGSVCDYSVYGRNQVRANDSDLFGGWVGARGNASMQVVGSRIHGGGLTASASLSAWYTYVYGDYALGSASANPPTYFQRAVSSSAPPAPNFPTRAVSSCLDEAETRSGFLPPGNYPHVTVPAGETLILIGGLYEFNSLVVETGAVLQLPPGGDRVEVNACGDIVFEQNARMQGPPTSDTGSVSLHASGSFRALGNNTLLGLILSQSSTYVGSHSSVYGVLASRGRTDVFSSLVDSTSLDDTCELFWDPGTTVNYPACPVTITPDRAEETGECVENLAGYEDETCSGFDLALGVPCDGNVPVCNHGTEEFLGSVDIGLYELGRNQLSTENPPTADFFCSESLTIAAGSCESLNCSQLERGAYTLLVDPDHLIAECDQRRLDNWTLQADPSCGGSLSNHEEVHRYEAECPPHAKPAWGLLSWSAETPGASQVVFEAATAASSSRLSDDPSYQVIGTAASLPTNTANCGVLSTAPTCPVDVTQLLQLGPEPEPFLQLKITLKKDGNDRPTLHDWRLSYSCIVDQ